VLATSRQPLGLTGEIAWRVPPLSLPEPLEVVSGAAGDEPTQIGPRGEVEMLSALLASEAGQLFLERARAARATFELLMDSGEAEGRRNWMREHWKTVEADV